MATVELFEWKVQNIPPILKSDDGHVLRLFIIDTVADGRCLLQCLAMGLDSTPTSSMEWAQLPKRFQYPMFADGRVDDASYFVSLEAARQIATSICEKLMPDTDDGGTVRE
jgi:hypothetical protein